jgi:hypothetical protein
MQAESSARRLSLSLSYSTLGTSMRSSSGPEMRFWYLVAVEEEQVQARMGFP